MEDDGGFHFMGPDTWSYNECKDVNIFIPHRVLPKPKDQGDNGTCLPNALVKCLESVVRLKRASLRPNLKTDNLSIQHCIDVGHAEGYNYGEGYATNYTEIDMVEFLQRDGVTSKNHYPFDGPPNDTVQYLQRSWCYHISDFKVYRGEEYKFSDLGFMRRLFDWLHNVGPFIGSFDLRTGHSDDMESRYTTDSTFATVEYNGESLIESHAVVITGYHYRIVKGSLKGYWVFQNSYGSNVGMNGMGTMDFDVLDTVITIKAAACGRIRYTD